MPRLEFLHEPLIALPGPDEVAEKARHGWKPATLIWVREAEDPRSTSRHEVPYGLRISGDCLHLEEDPVEMEVLRFLMESIVKDQSPAQTAAELNRLGFRTRDGAPWTQTSVFKLLPRLVDAGPGILSESGWPARRSQALASAHH